MLKRINVQSLLHAKESLDDKAFAEFLNYYGIEIKNEEIEDLKNLIKSLRGAGCSLACFQGFYLGYTIAQIGKEFDLLRFGRETIINIEIKNNSTEAKIRNQLIRNKYYLSFTGREIHTFTFISESQDMYFLDNDQQLVKTEVGQLIKLLSQQEVDDATVPHLLFNPSDYLVSPFNSTKNFWWENIS